MKTIQEVFTGVYDESTSLAEIEGEIFLIHPADEDQTPLIYSADDWYGWESPSGILDEDGVAAWNTGLCSKVIQAQTVEQAEEFLKRWNKQIEACEGKPNALRS